MSSNNNPFEKCPVYETDNLIFTKVKIEDAKELFECYSDPVTKGHMNNDNCGGEWNCHSIDVVRQGIRGWEREFADKFYIRWSVTHKQLNSIIGTVEIAPIPNTTRFWDGNCKTGILRMDIVSFLEKEAIFSEILRMVTDNFYTDFDLENIITKAGQDDDQRVSALRNNSFNMLGNNPFIPYNNYYIKSVKLKKKRLVYDSWTVITSKRYRQASIDKEFFKGIVALLYIDEVAKPQEWKCNGKRIVVCDAGMKWLQLIPLKANYVITAMMNAKNEIELWYIDMIAGYGIDSGNIAYFHDLYLDLIVYPNGIINIDDMDELIEALEKRVITPDLYKLALETSEKLQKGILKDVSGLRKLSMKCLEEIE